MKKLSPNMKAAMWTLHAMSNGLPAGRAEIPAKTFHALSVRGLATQNSGYVLHALTDAGRAWIAEQVYRAWVEAEKIDRSCPWCNSPGTSLIHIANCHDNPANAGSASAQAWRHVTKAATVGAPTTVNDVSPLVVPRWDADETDPRLAALRANFRALLDEIEVAAAAAYHGFVAASDLDIRDSLSWIVSLAKDGCGGCGSRADRGETCALNCGHRMDDELAAANLTNA